MRAPAPAPGTQQEVRSSAFSYDPPTIVRMCHAVCHDPWEGGEGGGPRVEEARTAVKRLLQALSTRAMMDEFTSSHARWDEAMGLLGEALVDDDALRAVRYVRSYIRADFFRSEAASADGTRFRELQRERDRRVSRGRLRQAQDQSEDTRPVPTRIADAPVTQSITVFKAMSDAPSVSAGAGDGAGAAAASHASEVLEGSPAPSHSVTGCEGSVDSRRSLHDEATHASGSLGGAAHESYKSDGEAYADEDGAAGDLYYDLDREVKDTVGSQDDGSGGSSGAETWEDGLESAPQNVRRFDLF